MKKIGLLLICLLVGFLLSACTTQAEILRIEADGSGDYPTLEEAIEAAPEGSDLLLGPGDYHLAESLNVQKSLHLIGEGMEQTEIVSDAPDYVIRFSGNGSFSIEGITFRHTDDAVADVVVVGGGKATFAHCRFTGAVWGGVEDDIDSLKPGLSAGLRLQGDTTAVVQDCIAVENMGSGVQAEDQVQLTLEESACTKNVVGLVYFDDASGTARQSEFSDNLMMGILVSNSAQPTLEENVCSSNSLLSGILYVQNAGGIARQNNCSENENAGIAVFGEAKPKLERNICTNNQFGIVIASTASPELVGNDCHDNTERDIQDDR